MKAEEAQDHRYEAKKQTTDRAKAAAAVEVVATTQAMDTRETATRVAISKDSLEQLPAKRTVIGGVALAPGVAAGGVQPFKKATPAKNLLVRARIPAPTHVLERLAQGRMRLTVTWASGNHLYVLRRTDSHILVLAPSTTSPAKAGAIVSTFEFSLGTKDHVDLYLLPQPATDPESLPAEGVLEGYRKRVL